jgi:plastocyanin
LNARSSLRISLVFVAAAVLAACGGSSSSALPAGYYITLSGMAFPVATLEAPAGATITVVNQSAMGHTVTQEAARDGFTLGAPAGTTPFDTGLFSAGTRTFSLPAGLADGTVLYYYCRTHTSLMVPSTGTITIRASAQPGPGPAGGGYGP